MPKISDTGCDMVSFLLGLGVGILVGMATGLHYFGVLNSSGDATGIGMTVGVGAALTTACLTWIAIKAIG